MAYELTPEAAASITDVELAFSTMRLLPAEKEIPDAFFRGNDYTRLAEALAFDAALPVFQVTIYDGFTKESVNRCVVAHLRSFGPSHGHKIAGVGFMISKMCELIKVAERAV